MRVAPHAISSTLASSGSPAACLSQFGDDAQTLLHYYPSRAARLFACGDFPSVAPCPLKT